MCKQWSYVFLALTIRYVFIWTFFFSVTSPLRGAADGDSDSSDVELELSSGSSGNDSNAEEEPQDPLATSSHMLQSLKAGDGVRYLLGHPESFLDDKAMAIIRKAPWSKRVSHIIVDEAHCVVQWGENFREHYRLIDSLKSAFAPHSPSTVAVTATATVAMQHEISRLLDMRSMETVIGHADRSNIKFCVKRRPANTGNNRTADSSYTAVFMPLMIELKYKRHEFPKTVVYANLKWCGFGNELGVRVLSDGKVQSTGVKEISQYHAPMTAQVQ